MATTIVLSRKTEKRALRQSTSKSQADLFVTPGDRITSGSDCMRGHGTYIDGDELTASLGGVIKRVNQHVSVHPLKSRYNGDVGDVVVGRITEVLQKRWKVDTGSRLDSVLALSSVNLPGGELRRRGAEDELMMRQFLQEGDVISAEVREIFNDGSLSLHTRSLKYGKLSQGTLVKVRPTFIKRQKTHFHSFNNGVGIIIGNNGNIWVGPMSEEQQDIGCGGYVHNLEPVKPQTREVIAKIRACILALDSQQMLIYETTISYVFEAAANLQVKDLMKSDVMIDVVEQAKFRLESSNG